MAAELATPVDEYSGLPYAIAPGCKSLPKNNPNKADRHHAFHPRRSPELQTVAGLALRNCRLQLVERDLHNEGPFRYHKFFYGQMDLPTDESDIFARCIMGVSGYTPDRVIDLRTGEPFDRPITPREAKFLRKRSQDKLGYKYITYNIDPIRKFFSEYVLKQNLSHLDDDIDEFLTTPDMGQKVKVGNFILAEAAQVACDAIKPKFAESQRHGLLHPRIPADVGELVLVGLGTPEHREACLLPQLESQLLAAA